MLITERFAWAHLPKTGGAATQAMFDAVPGLVEWADPQDSNAKHDPFREHEAQLGGKLLVMNIRRLPSWVLSHAHQRAVDGAWPEFEPQPMLTAEEMVEGRLPDAALRRMTDGSRFPVDRWLRQENLVEDVVSLLEDVGAYSDQARAGIATVPYKAKGYDHDVASTFTAAQIERMYMLNPAWAEIERRAYGDIHELARPGTVDSPIDEIDVDSWLTSIWGSELEAIDRKLAEVGPRIDNFALFRDLDDDLWALLLGRRYSTYKSILETLPLLPDPSLQQRWNGAHGMTLLGQGKTFYRHARTMYREHGNGDYGRARMLDFGCGWGRLTRFFARDVLLGALHGCDPSAETIEICRRSRLPAVLHRTELVPDELPEGNFDLAFSFSVFTEISEAAANGCLRALHAALNPSGLLILAIRPPFVPRAADPGHPQHEGEAMTSGEAVISLPHIRDRWGELFELLDVKVVTEDIHHVLITLRKR